MPEGLPIFLSSKLPSFILFPIFLASQLPSFPLLLPFCPDFKEPKKTEPVFKLSIIIPYPFIDYVLIGDFPKFFYF
jgi:hypothetical protein